MHVPTGSLTLPNQVRIRKQQAAEVRLPTADHIAPDNPAQSPFFFYPDLDVPEQVKNIFLPTTLGWGPPLSWWPSTPCR